ncbi:RND family transporter [Mesonia sp. K7]|uniref:efflux RND transporter permease subunit n=1 Tax=Mesonia sp. K7 TaxID=2218606 RepID=UPI000DA94A85|nr:efflux RND transporter permease subunit [Mesonia sp. K7]PZD78413.1 RND family transporter [Mesonia sp. K7]
MQKLFSFGFWNVIARVILRNRILFLGIIAAITVFLAFQWENMRFSYTEANLLPDHHPVNIEYNNFLDKFGDEGNLLVIATNDKAVFTSEKFDQWIELSKKLDTFEEVEHTIGIHNLKTLQKYQDPNRFELTEIEDSLGNPLSPKELKNEIFENLPFYEGLIYSKKSNTIQTGVYIDKDILNSKKRKEFILNKLQPILDEFKTNNNIEIHVSGMPYIRTLNSQNIIDEIGLFVGAALLVTSLIFFFFFRSVRATMISMFTVIIGVMWAFGFLGLFEFEITVLTAIIPPLIIVIGIPNCIFLINKYQQEIKNHGNQAKSLQRVITKVGNATLMTNITTASGFATFIITESTLLKEFGVIASINIVAIFILSLFLIPIIYSFLAPPKERHLKHLGKTWIENFVNWIVQTVKNRRIAIYISSLVLLVASIIGIYMIRVSGSLLDDMPKDTTFFRDIEFFEDEFNGIMPLEILIDTKREKGVMKLSTIKRLERLQELFADYPELSKPLSVVELVKYSKQAYYNGNPKYYQLPTSQEQNFILPYLKNMSDGKNSLLNAYVDSTGQYARITVFMKDIGTEKMERIEDNIWPKINKIFPGERYEVSMTGKALVFQKGTSYLVKNLVLSLGLAILLIAIFMAWMFRSTIMIVISLIPNLLPLIITAGMMGYLGIPIKPSTILVFSIAFGISVDDTIHFLAKYRQELKARNWRIKRSVYPALRETAVSMFYTSIVLFFGFSVFMISSFGGTVALGGLVSATLLFAMLSNLLLLPSLLLSLEKSVSNQKTFKKLHLDVIGEEEEFEDEHEK